LLCVVLEPDSSPQAVRPVRLPSKSTAPIARRDPIDTGGR
jgi:hypothetical protein